LFKNFKLKVKNFLIMLDLKYIREHAAEVKTNCRQRLAEVDIDRLLALDERKRHLLTGIQALRERRNLASKHKPTEEEIIAMKQVGQEIQTKENELKTLTQSLEELWLAVPNLTDDNVKISSDPDDNPVLKQVGEPTEFSFTPLDHLTLAQNLGLIDLERAAKVAGAKFYYLKGALAELEQALIAYALNIIKNHGFTMLATPYVARAALIEKLGFNPRGESTQVYNLAGGDLSLIGTAEITLGAYHAEETLAAKDLPKKYVAVTPCWRTEAGSYSKFSKGLVRVHQFNKVEMFIFSHPDQSELLHFEILKIEEEIWRGLRVPFRIIDHCTADLGNPSTRTFDLEAWLPTKERAGGQLGDWLEVTSCSNCTDYQARGLNIRFQDAETDSPQFPHTLNGTGIAVSRALVAILENCQQADGSIAIPKILRKYLSFNRITPTKI